MRPVLRNVVIGSVLSATLLHSSTASSEPITIRNGIIEVNPGSIFAGAGVGLVGMGGFQLSGSAGDGVTAFQLCGPCLPGETISLAGRMDRLGGSVNYRGTTHEFSFTRGDGGELLFEAPSFVLPRAAVLPTDFTFKTPFSMSGHAFFVYEPSARDVRLEFAGSGIATLHATVSPFDAAAGGQQYVLHSLRYEFGSTAAPVPEPGTMLLFGSGAVAAVLKTRRKRRSSVCK
jgi:hypothetical protein